VEQDGPNSGCGRITDYPEIILSCLKSPHFRQVHSAARFRGTVVSENPGTVLRELQEDNDYFLFADQPTGTRGRRRNGSMSASKAKQYE
jgi:hypothetical protein